MGSFESAAGKLQDLLSRWEDATSLFRQAATATRGESVKTLIRQLTATYHEALLVKLLSDKETFHQDAIDKKDRAIRKKVADGKIIKWKALCPQLRTLAEKVMAGGTDIAS